MTTDDVPLARPVITEAAIEAVAEVLRSGWPGPGAHVSDFERELAHELAAQHAVAVSSGTAALHLAVHLLDLAPGSEVITTPITFVATNQVLLYEGCVPVFADVDPASGNIDPMSVRSRIGPRTKAIVVVHLGGVPCDLDEIYAVAAEHGLAVIEDCAHALGASYRGRMIGSHASLQAFSFNSVKNLPMVEGGALVLPDSEGAARARRLRWMGIDRDTRSRTTESSYEWEYDVVELGFKYTMSDMHAVLGRAQLPSVRTANARRAELAQRYTSGLDDLRALDTPDVPGDRTSSWCLYQVRADCRDELLASLSAAGVGCGVHYKRNDLYRMFDRADLPGAEQFWTRTLSLPLHLQMTDDDADRVVEAVRKAVFEVAGG